MFECVSHPSRISSSSWKPDWAQDHCTNTDTPPKQQHHLEMTFSSYPESFLEAPSPPVHQNEWASFCQQWALASVHTWEQRQTVNSSKLLGELGTRGSTQRLHDHVVSMAVLYLLIINNWSENQVCAVWQPIRGWTLCRVHATAGYREAVRLATTATCQVLN